MVFSSDRQYTIRPAAGTQLTLDLGRQLVHDPGRGRPERARRGDAATAFGDAGGTVPATLALTMGAPATFGAFTPGVAKEYTASTTATVISTAGDATLSVADPSTHHHGPPGQRRVRAAAAAAGPRRRSRRAPRRSPTTRRRSRSSSDRRQRRAAHGHVQQDADVHPVHHDAVDRSRPGVEPSPRPAPALSHLPHVRFTADTLSSRSSTRGVGQDAVGRRLAVAGAIAVLAGVVGHGARRRRCRRRAATFPGVAAAAPAPGARGPDVRQRHGAGRLRQRHGELRQPRAVGRDRRRHRLRRQARTASTSTSRARARPTPTASRSR